MECVEAALKSSLRKDMALKLTPQALLEDLSAFNVQNITSCEDFSVDDLLDFSHEEGILPQQQQQEPEQQQNHTPVSVSPQHNNTQNQSHEACYPLLNDHFGSLLPTTELSVPVHFSSSFRYQKKKIFFNVVKCKCWVLSFNQSCNFYRRKMLRTWNGCLISLRIPSQKNSPLEP